MSYGADSRLSHSYAGDMKPKVVIVGAGFGGLASAKHLADRPVDVTLLDANNYHLFTPLLYQVASSLLNPSDIARPVRSIFSGKRNIRFRQAEVTDIDFETRIVYTSDGCYLPYDYLILATGSTTNFFGMQSIEQFAFGLKDLPEALELRNHILRCLETATLKRGGDRAPWLTFVVGGGGPTGVEYAGALSELVSLLLPDEYPELASTPIRVVLVEGEEEVLPPFPDDLGHAARRALQQKGVEVHTGVRIVDVDGQGVMLSDGERIAANTLVWAAGVKPNRLATKLDVPRSRSGRVSVDPFLRVQGQDRVFAIGDIASFMQAQREVPMLAAPAMQQGRAAASNVLRSAAGAPLKRFHYRDKGSIATIGKNQGVAQVGPVHLKGFLGWVTWLVVHLYYIIGFRNRLIVLTSWAWNYVRSDRPVRIIARAQERDRAHKLPPPELPTSEDGSAAPEPAQVGQQR